MQTVNELTAYACAICVRHEPYIDEDTSCLANERVRKKKQHNNNNYIHTQTHPDRIITVNKRIRGGKKQICVCRA